MCVIISSIDRETNDEHLIDKSAILCSLNIKAMNFNDSTGLLGGDQHNIVPGLSPESYIPYLYSQNNGIHIPMLTELSIYFVLLKFLEKYIFNLY
jgi:hypothetical protein